MDTAREMCFCLMLSKIPPEDAFGPACVGRAGQGTSAMKPNLPRWTAAVLAVAMAALLAGGAWLYRFREDNLRQATFKDLAAIATLKVGQIARWRAERLANASSIMGNPFFSAGIARWRSDPTPENSAGILGFFRSVRDAYGYRDVSLIDQGGRPLLSLSGREATLAGPARALPDAARERKPVLTDLAVGTGYPFPHLHVVAPIFAGEPGNERLLGAVVLTSGAEDFLYPLIQAWPTPSATAETLLVRRDGDAALFLNDLRHRNDAALTLRIPLDHLEVPAVRGITGATGPFEGRDYRGVDVLSFLSPVPASPWFIIAKVDTAEVFAGWRFESAMILALTAGFAAVLIAAGLVSLHGASRRHYQELYRAESERRAIAERQGVILRSIGDAVIAADLQGRVELLNPAAEALTGWRGEEALGLPLADVFRIVSEDTGQILENPVAKVLSEGVVVGLANHTLLVARDGTKRPIADSAAPILGARGAIAGVVLIFRDQSAERAAKRALAESAAFAQAILDSSWDGIKVLDADGRLEYMNAGGQAQLGIDDIRPWLGRQYLEFWSGSDKMLAKAAFAAARTGRTGRFEGSRPTVSGQPKWWDVMVAPLAAGAPGGAFRLLVVSRDVTELTLAREELARGKQAAEAASRAKSEFLANMSHEIRTPLGGVLGMLQLLQAVSPDGEQQEYLQAAVASAKRLSRLLTDILDLSKIEAGKLSLFETAFALGEMRRSVLELFTPAAAEKGLALDVAFDPGLPERLTGDDARLRQILFNLVGNAVKFTDSGRVTVEASLVSAPGAVPLRVLFSVADTGIGIPAARLDELFAPFTQVDGSYVRQHQGAGLGLAIVRRLVRLMGGEACIESQEGAGTRIFWMLPFGEAPAEAPASETRTPVPPPHKARRLHILLAEDEEVNLLAIKRLLERHGYSVTTAGNGRQALDLLASGDFDAVIMDVQMPVMDGVEATRIIRSAPEFAAKSDIPIIALTAYSMAGDKEKFLNAGMNDYLAKPVETSAILEALRAMVE
jgi:PAS domain S-box-containing protein